MFNSTGESAGLVHAVGEEPIQEGGVGESHGLGHELLALKIVEVGDSGEAVEDQSRQLSFFMLLAAFCHLNHRVGASALVAQDGAGELEQGVLDGGGAPCVPAARSGDHLLTQFVHLKHRLSDEKMALDNVVTL